MYINVSLQAVKAVERIVESARAMLIGNFNNFSSDVQNTLAEWNDANVQKFIQLFGSMTGNLKEILVRLNGIESFCREVERLIIAYNG